MIKQTLVFLIVLAALAGVVSADVGIGVSPSRSNVQVEAGKEITLDFLVFNTGDGDLDVTISTEGEISDYVELSETTLSISPEPKPHTRPIKNGKSVSVTFKAPVSARELKGLFVATAAPGGGTLGGSVSIASTVDLKVLPAQGLIVTTTQWTIIGALLGIVLLYIVWRRMGLQIKIKKK